MKMLNRLSAEFHKRLLGSLTEQATAGLKIKVLEGTDEKQAAFRVSLCDEEGVDLFEIGEGAIDVGGSFTMLGFDRVFNITFKGDYLGNS